MSEKSSESTVRLLAQRKEATVRAVKAEASVATLRAALQDLLRMTDPEDEDSFEVVGAYKALEDTK